MEKIRYRLIYNRKKRLRSDHMGLVQIEAYLNRKRKYFSTHIYIYPSQWDAEKRRIYNHPHAEDLNWMLVEYIVKLEAIEIALWKRGEKISLDKLKHSFSESSSPLFLPFMAEEIERSHIRNSTRENRYTTYNLLRAYEDKLTFDQLTPYFLSKFESWLVSRGYHINTVAKHLSHLRIYVNAAILQGYIRDEDNPFHKRRIAHKTFKHVFLSPFELEKLERMVLPPKLKHLQTTADAFCFCCYTGLRYSDFIRLGESSIQRGITHTWINIECHKTGVPIRLPIDMLFEGKALSLISKYADRLESFFRLPSNSTVDKQLLTIGRYAGLTKHFSFHTARHTNATLLLAQGVSVTTVQKLLGHKNIKTTMNYCETIDLTIINDLKRTGQ